MEVAYLDLVGEGYMGSMQWQLGRYSRTLDCEQLGLRVFYKTSKNFEGILT
jgi:hypothetical protein